MAVDFKDVVFSILGLRLPDLVKLDVLRYFKTEKKEKDEEYPVAQMSNFDQYEPLSKDDSEASLTTIEEVTQDCESN